MPSRGPGRPGENTDTRAHNQNMNGMSKEKRREDQAGLGREFSPRRELALMARVMTRWLRANGFPGETLGASTAAELEIRFAVTGPGNAGRVLARGLIPATED